MTGTSGAKRISSAVVLIGACLAGTHVNAGDDQGKKDLFGRPAASEPFMLTVFEPGRLIELTGIVERSDGVFWVSGYSEDQATGAGTGLLLAVGSDGSIIDQHEFSLGAGVSTQFWWPVLLDGGRIALAVTLDPYSDRRNGGVAIVDDTGAMLDHVLLTDRGYPGGEVSHLAQGPDGDLFATGFITASVDINHAMVARFSPELEMRWLSTDQARGREFSLAGFVSAPLSTGGTVAIGTAVGPDFEETSGWLAYFDEHGAIGWRKWLDAGLFDLVDDTWTTYGNWVATTRDGELAYMQTNYDQAGHTSGSVMGWVSADGDLIRHIPLAPAPQAGLYALAPALNGDILAAGDRGDNALPIIVRVRPGGELVWSQTLQDVPNGYAWSVIEADDGSIMATGANFDQDGNAGGWVARLGADGSQQ